MNLSEPEIVNSGVPVSVDFDKSIARIITLVENMHCSHDTLPS